MDLTCVARSAWPAVGYTAQMSAQDPVAGATAAVAVDAPHAHLGFSLVPTLPWKLKPHSSHSCWSTVLTVI